MLYILVGPGGMMGGNLPRGRYDRNVQHIRYRMPGGAAGPGAAMLANMQPGAMQNMPKGKVNKHSHSLLHKGINVHTQRSLVV